MVHTAHDDESDRHCADDCDADSSEEAKENKFAHVDFDTNAWSVQFALDCFNAVSGQNGWSAFKHDVWLLADVQSTQGTGKLS